MNTRAMFGLVIVALAVLALPVHASTQAGLEDNKELCQRYFDEIWTGQDFTAMGEILAPNFVAHNPFGGDMDQAAYKEYILGIYDGSPDLLVEPGIMMAEGDLVAMTWYMEGTSTNEWSGLQPTNEKWTLSGLTIHRVENGRITDEWAFLDTMNLLQQLNAVPAEGDVPMPTRIELKVDDTAPDDLPALIADWLVLHDNLETASRLLTEDVVVHEPLAFFPEAIAGRDAVIAWQTGSQDLMPGYRIMQHPDTAEITQVAEGNLAVVMAQMEYTFSQEMSGIPPNGAVIQVPFAALFRFDNNQFAEIWIVYDTMHWMNQMLAPAE